VARVQRLTDRPAPGPRGRALHPEEQALTDRRNEIICPACGQSRDKHTDQQWEDCLASMN